MTPTRKTAPALTLREPAPPVVEVLEEEAPDEVLVGLLPLEVLVVPVAPLLVVAPGVEVGTSAVVAYHTKSGKSWVSRLEKGNLILKRKKSTNSGEQGGALISHAVARLGDSWSPRKSRVGSERRGLRVGQGLTTRGVCADYVLKFSLAGSKLLINITGRHVVG